MMLPHQVPYRDMAAARSRLLRPHARADVIVCTKHHQSGDRSLCCIASEFYQPPG